MSVYERRLRLVSSDVDMHRRLRTSILFGLMQEAASYFAPASSCTAALEAAARFDGCTPLRRPPLSGESAVGLIRLEMGRLIISPVRYGASRGGARGLWQLDMLETAAV